MTVSLNPAGQLLTPRLNLTWEDQTSGEKSKPLETNQLNGVQFGDWGKYACGEADTPVQILFTAGHTELLGGAKRLRFRLVLSFPRQRDIFCGGRGSDRGQHDMRHAESAPRWAPEQLALDRRAFAFRWVWFLSVPDRVP